MKKGVFIVEQYFKNNEGLAAAVRNFYRKYGGIRETRSINDLKHSGCPPKCRSTQNIAAVRGTVGESLGASIHRRAEELDISRSSL